MNKNIKLFKNINLSIIILMKFKESRLNYTSTLNQIVLFYGNQDINISSQTMLWSNYPNRGRDPGSKNSLGASISHSKKVTSKSS